MQKRHPVSGTFYGAGAAEVGVVGPEEASPGLGPVQKKHPVSGTFPGGQSTHPQPRTRAFDESRLSGACWPYTSWEDAGSLGSV